MVVSIKCPETYHQPSKLGPIQKENSFGMFWWRTWRLKESVLLGVGLHLRPSHVLSLSASIVASDHGPIPATPSASAKPAASMGFDGMGVR